MAKKKIIFQGEPGANSDLACREAYPDYEPVPCSTFEDCFSALSAYNDYIVHIFSIVSAAIVSSITLYGNRTAIFSLVFVSRISIYKGIGL